MGASHDQFDHLEGRPVNVTLKLDLDAARDVLACAFAGRHLAYVDHLRVDRALQEAQRQLKRQDPDSPNGNTKENP